VAAQRAYAALGFQRIGDLGLHRPRGVVNDIAPWRARQQG
jgi:hypothetical protein